MNEEKDGHITTRVDPAIKQEGKEWADNNERTPAWTFAKAIELGLPLVKKQYSLSKTKKAA